MKYKKIAIIGNCAAGKTELGRVLSKSTGIPVFHVDSLQFVENMKIRSHQETIQDLTQIENLNEWIIDGFGPLDILEQRLIKADLVLFIDLPLWRHYWWLTKRQIKSIWSPRQELPSNCSDLSWPQIKKLYRGIWQVHTKMRPEMLKILARQELKSKVVIIRTVSDFSKFQLLPNR